MIPTSKLTLVWGTITVNINIYLNKRKIMRKKFQIKSSLVGSSELTRVKSAEAIRQMNHREFAKNVSLMTFLEPTDGKEPKPNTVVKVFCGGKYIACQYSIVKKAGYKNWKL